MTSKLAAPALPTLIVMGLTRALLAKFWIFLGIVALNSSVCLWPWMKQHPPKSNSLNNITMIIPRCQTERWPRGGDWGGFK